MNRGNAPFIDVPFWLKKLKRWAASQQLLRTAHQAINRRQLREIISRFRFGKKHRMPSVKVLRMAQNMGSDDYLVWGVIDWHLRFQRPQQIARELVKEGHVVLYISPLFVHSKMPGFTVENLDDSGRLFQVRLFVAGAFNIYEAAPSSASSDQLRKSLGELLIWSGSQRIVSMVNHPFWTRIAEVVPQSRIVYDCMDYHPGFPETGASITTAENRLMEISDLVVTTSDALDSHASLKSRRRAIVRNGCDFSHFAHKPKDTFRDPLGRRVFGYYGAIAQWFDADLIAIIANQHTDCAIVLVGADTAQVQSRLKHLTNVTFVGEVNYDDLPYYVHGFDVCLLPFKMNALTRATNPVKVYEYLSAGKPVVSVDLPELKHFEGLVHIGGSPESINDCLESVKRQPPTDAKVASYKEFASRQTWRQRVNQLKCLVEEAKTYPLVSIIVVSYNTRDLTEQCLQSISEYSNYPNLEIIVVDNNSQDGTVEYLKQWQLVSSKHKLVCNTRNRGFAAANNQGVALAQGEYLVLLNSDTHVTPGWIHTLITRLEQNRYVGIIGPVTNNIGNEAKIAIAYNNMDEMLAVSRVHSLKHLGELTPLHAAAFFCVMMRRSSWDAVGTLDEDFGLGYFEDDDYCRRIQQLGLSVGCANDVFIHHELSASFNKVENKGRTAILESSRKVYEAKWGPWKPHRYRKRQQFTTSKLAGLYTDYFVGHCNVCGNDSKFYFNEARLFRESLVCENCKSTSRYRSIARGILKALGELADIKAESLSHLPRECSTRIRVCDTQVPFVAESCAYTLPAILERYPWISVETTLFRTDAKLGCRIANNSSIQNLECLTFSEQEFDIFVTSDVMEHVRLDCKAHSEIARVLKAKGIYVFTVPHDMSWEKNRIRVEIREERDPARDVHVMPAEYHGDTNSDSGAGCLAYRAYGREIVEQLASVGFEATYTKADVASCAILNTELFYCRKSA